MTNQNSEGTESPTSQDSKQDTDGLRGASSEAFSKASDFARDAAEKAKRAAADTAASMTDSVMSLLNEQIGAGAHTVSRFARSTRGIIAIDIITGTGIIDIGTEREREHRVLKPNPLGQFSRVANLSFNGLRRHRI